MTALVRLRIFLFVVAVCSIFWGVNRGEAEIIFNKAIRICMECIGLG